MSASEMYLDSQGNWTNPQEHTDLKYLRHDGTWTLADMDNRFLNGEGAWTTPELIPHVNKMSWTKIKELSDEILAYGNTLTKDSYNFLTDESEQKLLDKYGYLIGESKNIWVTNLPEQSTDDPTNQFEWQVNVVDIYHKVNYSSNNSYWGIVFMTWMPYLQGEWWAKSNASKSYCHYCNSTINDQVIAINFPTEKDSEHDWWDDDYIEQMEELKNILNVPTYGCQTTTGSWIGYDYNVNNQNVSSQYPSQFTQLTNSKRFYVPSVCELNADVPNCSYPYGNNAKPFQNTYNFRGIWSLSEKDFTKPLIEGTIFRGMKLGTAGIDISAIKNGIDEVDTRSLCVLHDTYGQEGRSDFWAGRLYFNSSNQHLHVSHGRGFYNGNPPVYNAPGEYGQKYYIFFPI